MRVEDRIGGDLGATADYSIEAWRRVVEINLFGVFYCMKYEIPAMLAGGGGAIVNMASILGDVGFANAPAYVSAKHGVVGLTRTAALEYGPLGIRVNSVGPAFIRTPMIAALEEDPATLRSLVDSHPLGRLGEPADIAAAVAYLASPAAGYVTGCVLHVNGGMYMA